MLEDLRGAVHRLFKKPGAAAAAVIALAVGIGLSTSMYSVADALLLRPLPIPDIDRVVMLGAMSESDPASFHSVTPYDFSHYALSSRSTETLAASRPWAANLTGAGDPVPIEGARVTSSFFEVMRIQPLLGRVFLKEEDSPGSDRSVVLSHNLWERQFGASPDILGRTIELSGRAFQVVGVMPKGFTFPPPSDFWVPLALTFAEWTGSDAFYLRVCGRLQPGTTLDQARAEFKVLAGDLARQFPANHGRLSARVELIRHRVSGDLTPQYTRITIAAALFLLFIACLNVAGLQFSRVLSRTREMAVRGALGAPRLRLLRQVVAESILVALAGAALGLFVAAWSLDLMKSSMPPEVERFLPGWQRLGLNGLVLFYTALTAVAAGIVSGLGPALWLSRTPILENLHESGRSATGTAARHRLRNFLVAGEIAVALVLLSGAALMVKGFRAIGRLPVTTDPARVLTLRITLPQHRYPDHLAVAAFQGRLLDSLSRAPGVQSAAITSNLPYSDSTNRSFVTIEGRPSIPGGRPQDVAQVQNISGSFFPTLGIPLLRGRAFSGAESRDAQRTAIVTAAFVKDYFPGEDPLGRRFHLGDGAWWTITGVAGDVLHNFTGRAPEPLVYLPYTQSGWGAFDVALRTSGDPYTLMPQVRQAVRDIDPSQPLALVRSFRKLIDDSTIGIGYVASILSVLAGVALFLAVLGVYSLMAGSVRERTREIGIRLALGARRPHILRMVFREGLLLAAVGIPVGLASSLGAATLLRRFLFGVTSLDPLAFVAMPLALTCALLAAGLIPALRATRTDPLIALRHE
ncbi:MAG: ABC transporter permease [Candidatus Solibacter usitatus]|nr:ABC transporter permease [Candidatus Solibacter usitatus]